MENTTICISITFQQLAELLILTSAETFQQLAFKFYRKWNHLIIDGQS